MLQVTSTPQVDALHAILDSTPIPLDRPFAPLASLDPIHLSRLPLPVHFALQATSPPPLRPLIALYAKQESTLVPLDLQSATPVLPD